MAPPILALQDVTIGFGSAALLEGADLAIGRGERLCLVGRNGAGKSTLLKIAAGLVEPDRGRRFVQPGCRVAYLPQDPAAEPGVTVAAHVAAGLPAEDGEAAHRVAAILEAVRLDGDRPLATLSGGEGRRAALARVLVAPADVLLLDEPTNHLDLPTIEWLERELARRRGAVVVVSHDRALLDRVTRGVVWLDRGVLRRLDRGFAEFEAWSAQVLTEKAEERARLDKRIAADVRWLRTGITARRRRNQGRLRRLAAARAERAGWIGPAGQVRLRADRDALSGRLVIEADAVSKSYDGRPVIEGFSTRILRGDRMGIVGPNGAGKTTLLRLLVGELEPDAGTVRLGTNLTPVHVDQDRSVLAPGATVRDVLCPQGGDQVMVRGRPRHVVAYLRDFLFEGHQPATPVASLSGGERNRLLLARGLARPSNLLILDEPTNDLDMDTLDLLQEVLGDYDGTVLLVSHDRDFLDRLVTSTIALEGDGRAVEYAGGYSDFVRQRGEREAPDTPTAPAKAAAKPRRPKAVTKLSYRHQRALDELPGRIAALEEEIVSLESILADPELYGRDADAFRRAAARLEQARQERAACEDQWLEIELLRESLAAGDSG